MAFGRREEGRKFKYTPRSQEQIQKRAEQRGGSRDSVFKPEYPIYKVKTGLNRLRALPPTWEAAEHWGYDIYVHSQIGADGGYYLCNKEHKKSDECVLDNERQAANAEGDKAYADKLKAQHRVAGWVIDRDNEKDGPQLFSMAWTLDRDISKVSQDPTSGEVLNIDDPDNGYDFSFDYKAPAKEVPGKFEAVQIARRSSSLGDDKWLDYVMEHPIPDCLQFFDNEYIAKVFAGKPKPTEKEKEKDNKADEKSSGGDVPTWDEIQNAEISDLEDYAIKELKFSEREVGRMSEQDLKDEICKELKLKAPEKEAEGTGTRDRLKALREKTR